MLSIFFFVILQSVAKQANSISCPGEMNTQVLLISLLKIMDTWDIDIHSGFWWFEELKCVHCLWKIDRQFTCRMGAAVKKKKKFCLVPVNFWFDQQVDPKQYWEEFCSILFLEIMFNSGKEFSELSSFTGDMIFVSIFSNVHTDLTWSYFRVCFLSFLLISGSSKSIEISSLTFKFVASHQKVYFNY